MFKPDFRKKRFVHEHWIYVTEITESQTSSLLQIDISKHIFFISHQNASKRPNSKKKKKQRQIKNQNSACWIRVFGLFGLFDFRLENFNFRSKSIGFFIWFSLIIYGFFLNRKPLLFGLVSYINFGGSCFQINHLFKKC